MFIRFTLNASKSTPVCELPPVAGLLLPDSKNEHIFSWKSLDKNNSSKMDARATVPISTGFDFTLYFCPQLKWRSVQVHCDSGSFNLNGTNETYAQNIGMFEGWLHLEYRAKKVYVSEYQGLMIDFTLLAINVVVPNMSMVVDTLLHEHRMVAKKDGDDLLNKVVAVVTLKTSPTKTTIPLGRAQRIQSVHVVVEGTKKGTDVRRYSWNSVTSKEKKQTMVHQQNSFPGVPRRSSMNSHVDDLLDYEALKQGPLLSARELRSYVPDNDNYSNDRIVLPILVPKGTSVCIQFYNAYKRPAPVTGCTLVYDDFVTHLVTTPMNAHDVDEKVTVSKEKEEEDEEEFDEKEEHGDKNKKKPRRDSIPKLLLKRLSLHIEHKQQQQQQYANSTKQLQIHLSPHMLVVVTFCSVKNSSDIVLEQIQLKVSCYKSILPSMQTNSRSLSVRKR